MVKIMNWKFEENISQAPAKTNCQLKQFGVGVEHESN